MGGSGHGKHLFRELIGSSLTSFNSYNRYSYETNIDPDSRYDIYDMEREEAEGGRDGPVKRKRKWEMGNEINITHVTFVQFRCAAAPHPSSSIIVVVVVVVVT